MKIGELELKVGAPNAERLLESTGYSPAAMRELLAGHVMAGTVAAALLACAEDDDVPERHALALLIEAEGTNGVRAQVCMLYPPARAKKGRTQ